MELPVLVSKHRPGRSVGRHTRIRLRAVVCRRYRRHTLGGSLFSVFAIWCPVCNKLVVLALGTGGAMTYFAPVHPVLGFLSVGLQIYALRVRLAGERSCAVAAGVGSTDDRGRLGPEASKEKDTV